MFGQNREKSGSDVNDFNYLQQQIENAEKNGQPVEKYVMRQIDLLKETHDEFLTRAHEEGYRLESLQVDEIEIRQYSSMKALAEGIGLPVEEYDELIRAVRVRILGEEVVQNFFDDEEKK
jgi:hypothetical protein